QTSILTQPRPEHIPLNKHPPRIEAGETPFCDKCKAKCETLFHLIMICLKYQKQNNKMRNKLPQEKVTFATLLLNEHAILVLLQYG
ncbi:hypothetical protein BU17DRAFT_56490, partial [Hysterangium stoloniferum]